VKKESIAMPRIESQYERNFAVNVIREILVTVNRRAFSRLKVFFPYLFNSALKRLRFMPGLKKISTLSSFLVQSRLLVLDRTQDPSGRR
jgi:hypothetical protein